MINLGTRPVEPVVLSSKIVTSSLDKLVAKIHAGDQLCGKDFKNKCHWTKVKKDLYKYQNGKCCFCERKRDPNGEADVDHFRPKLAVNNKPAPNHPGYWWLVYDWHNLFFVCKECNSKYKRNEFPLIEETQRVDDHSINVNQEQPFLIDPSKEDPEQFISYDWAISGGKVVIPQGYDKEGRGKNTIKITGLDRLDLCEDRARLIHDMKTLVFGYFKFQELMAQGEKGAETMFKKIVEQIKEKISSTSRYTGFARYYFKSNLLGEYENLK